MEATDVIITLGEIPLSVNAQLKLTNHDSALLMPAMSLYEKIQVLKQIYSVNSAKPLGI